MALGNTQGSSAPESLIARLPADAQAMHAGDDMRLTLVMLTVEARSERDARNQALDTMRQASKAVGWSGTPEVRSARAV